LGDDVDILYLDAERLTLEAEDVEPVRAWVEDGGVLVVFGRMDWPELGVWTMEIGPGEVAPTAEGHLLGLPAPRLPGDPRGLWSTPESLTSYAGFGDGRAFVAGAYLGEGAVVAVGDGAPLRNGALLVPDNERFLAQLPALVSSGPGDSDLRVEVATTAGVATVDPFTAVAHAQLLPLVLQGLALLAGVVWWRGRTFGISRESDRKEVGSFADHARALGARYRRLRSPRAQSMSELLRARRRR
jgi:hypothetical protein